MHLQLIMAFGLMSFTSQAVVPQTTPESEAFSRIQTEKNVEAKRKLAAGFEKSFPKSERLPELYMELSRALVSSIDFASAKQYAEQSVAAVARMKSEPSYDQPHQAWLDSLEANTKKNLAWVNDMIAWREQQVRSSVLRKR